MFGNVRGGNYGSVGQQINKQNQVLNQLNMELSPDYGKIAEESIKGRSRERRAAIAAEAQVNRVGLDAMAAKKVYEIDAKTEKEVADIKRPAKRFAGIVGAAGTLTGAAVLKKFSDEQQARDDERDKRYEEHLSRIEEAYNRERPGLYQLPDPPQYQRPDLQDPTVSTSSDSSDGATVGSDAVSVTGKPQEMYAYLTGEKGLSHNHAVGLLANIRRESNFRTNVWGDNGTSNGLFQWHKDRLTRMQAAVPDWQTNWRGQLDYALVEKGEPGQQYLATNWRTEGDAAAFWTRKWERPQILMVVLPSRTTGLELTLSVS